MVCLLQERVLCAGHRGDAHCAPVVLGSAITVFENAILDGADEHGFNEQLAILSLNVSVGTIWSAPL